MALRFPKLRKYVRDVYAPAFLDAYRQNLLEKDKVASGDLVAEARLNYRTTPTEFDLIFSNVDYWEYVEEGRRPGSFPPVEAMLTEIRIKPIIPRPDEKGRIPTENQLAFLIGRKIAEKGIPGTFAYADAQASTSVMLGEEFDRIFAEDVSDHIGEEIQSIARLTIG